MSSPSSNDATSDSRAAGQISRRHFGSASVNSWISRISFRSPARVGGLEKKAATSSLRRSTVSSAARKQLLSSSSAAEGRLPAGASIDVISLRWASETESSECCRTRSRTASAPAPSAARAATVEYVTASGKKGRPVKSSYSTYRDGGQGSEKRAERRGCKQGPRGERGKCQRSGKGSGDTGRHERTSPVDQISKEGRTRIVACFEMRRACASSGAT
eukprot:scaffold26563_cov107-Isochrysis_galbana.AAC.2